MERGERCYDQSSARLNARNQTTYSSKDHFFTITMRTRESTETLGSLSASSFSRFISSSSAVGSWFPFRRSRPATKQSGIKLRHFCFYFHVQGRCSRGGGKGPEHPGPEQGEGPTTVEKGSVCRIAAAWLKYIYRLGGPSCGRKGYTIFKQTLINFP